MSTIINKLLTKMFYYKSRVTRNPFEQNLIFSKHFSFFNAELKSLTNTKLEPHFKLRCTEIYDIVEKYDVKTIVEIGTGRTTFLFNIISGVNCISVEQDKGWFEIIDRVLRKHSLNAEIFLSSVSAYKNGARFDELPFVEPDLLYIDAPYFQKDEQKKGFETFTGKPAYYDFETYFARGVFPKIIMIEGRTDTADEILNSDFSSKYNFEGEFIFCVQRKRYFSSIKLLRHSVFVLK